jgi:4'-phosphopantetheinyl transferase
MTIADIQLWNIDINPANHTPGELESLLSDEERERAAKFRFDGHRDRWVAGRAMLRNILADVTQQTPESVAFKYNEHEKPRLHSSSGHEAVHFNLTHSGDLALLAVTTIGPVGIDIEQVKRLPNIDLVVDRFFSAAEKRAFNAVRGDDDRLQAFYACWTCKEAYLKALGCGISKPTDTFDVTFLADTEPRIVAIDGEQSAAKDWLLFDLNVAPGYVGALAIESKNDLKLVWREPPPLATGRSTVEA